MKKLVAFCCILLSLLFVPLPVLAAIPDAAEELEGALNSDGTLDEDDLNVGGAILVDAHSGEVLFEKNADEQYFPASITKIMTCLLVLEHVEEHPEALNSTVTVQKTYVLEDNASNIGAKVGEQFNFKDLMYGLMLASGNEVGIILGEEIAGDIDTFIDRMNEKAQELGMTNTHYENPHGLNDPEHLTTARDQALLAVEAMKNDLFRQIVTTNVYTCPATNLSGARVWPNHNLLLVGADSSDSEAYDKAIGIKTGYTSLAKCTLVSAAREDETQEEYIAVVLYGTNSAARFKSCRIMLEYGFTHYDLLDGADYLDQFDQEVPVNNAESGETFTAQAVGEDLYYTDAAHQIEEIKADPGGFLEMEYTWHENLTAPIAKGDVVGIFTMKCSGLVLGTGNMVAAEDVAALPESTPELTAAPGKTIAPVTTSAPDRKDMTWQAKLWVALLVLLALLFIALLSALIYQLRQAQLQKDKERAARTRKSHRTRKR